MTVEHVIGQDVLRSNRALRGWAAGLREWSQCARGASSLERGRTRSLSQRSAVMRPTPRAAELLMGPTASGSLLPSLGGVLVSELARILVDFHDFSLMRATHELAVAVLESGYPAGHETVAAADAFEMLDRILHLRAE